MRRIACIVDVKGKVQYKRAKKLQSMFPDIKLPIYISKPGLRIPKEFYAVYYMSHGVYGRCKIKHPNLICSITSHKCLDNMKQTGRILRKFKKISVNNMLLLDALSEFKPVYLPNGVDTTIYTPRENITYDRKRIKLGWTGNIDRMAKNFRLVKALSSIRGCSLTMIKTTKSRRLRKKESHMRKFYHGLDYYVVTSSTEGTPNPALEAASCGIPVITTSVGNMPELIRHKKNGFFCRAPKITSYKKLLRMIRKKVTEEMYIEMSRAIAKDIRESWDWSYREQGYRDFFS